MVDRHPSSDRFSWLTAIEERELLLQYGYPFPDAKAQLERYASSPDGEILTISRFYLTKWSPI